jgi:ribonucleoside-diphosphate reductase alpha chain
VSVKDDEWMRVGSYVYDNFDIMSGVSFLPLTEHIYKQAPYQDCTRKQYRAALAAMPSSIDWKRLGEYEREDNTHGSQTLNCTGDFCEIVDLV